MATLVVAMFSVAIRHTDVPNQRCAWSMALDSLAEMDFQSILDENARADTRLLGFARRHVS